MVNDSEPRYQLVDSDGNVVGSLFATSGGTLVLQEGTSGSNNELELATDGTVTLLDLTANNSITDASGTQHTGELADLADVEVTSLEPTQATSGEEPSASGTDALALAVDQNAQAQSEDDIAIGNGATTASGEGNQIAIGKNATVDNNGSVAIGRLAEDTASVGGFSTAVGTAAQTTGSQSVALGASANVTADVGMALGRFAEVSHEQSITLGFEAFTRGANRFSVSVNRTGQLGNKTPRLQLELRKSGRLQIGPNEDDFEDVSTMTQVRRYS